MSVPLTSRPPEDATEVLDAFSSAVMAVVERLGPSVVEVVPGSAGELAGLRVGDILVFLDGVALPSLSALQGVLNADRIRRPVPTLVIRRGERIELVIHPDEA